MEPKDEKLKDWLMAICDERYEGDLRPIVGSAWTVKFGDQVWSVSTDGKTIAAVNRELGFPDGVEHLEKFSPFVPLEPGKILVSLADVRSWAGEPQWTSERPCECPDCEEGSHRGMVEMRMGFLFGVAVDRNRIAQALSGVEGEAIALSRPVERQAIHFAGDGWRVAVMPCVQREYEGATHFPPAAEERHP